MAKKYFVYVRNDTTIESYRVNEYERDLLLQIQKFEKVETTAEALRMILREAARARGLHPRLTPLAQPTNGGQSKSKRLIQAKEHL